MIVDGSDDSECLAVSLQMSVGQLRSEASVLFVSVSYAWHIAVRGQGQDLGRGPLW